MKPSPSPSPPQPNVRHPPWRQVVRAPEPEQAEERGGLLVENNAHIRQASCPLTLWDKMTHTCDACHHQAGGDVSDAAAEGHGQARAQRRVRPSRLSYPTS
jgi:hypothetical protein